MNIQIRNPDISRRGLMIGAAGFTFAIASGLRPGDAKAASGKDVTLSPWVTIATDDTVAIMSPAAEMGQGSLTSLPLILAEELDADWAKVRVVVAPPNDALYKNPAFGYMYTAGSNAVTAYFKDLRQFGAQVRKVLLANAAKHWNVPVAELTTGPNVVIHEKSGRRLSYGEIASFAEVPAQAPEVAESELKKPDQFRLIGKDVMRVELPQKVNGTAQYAIDVQVPGMLYGAILRSPVEGGAPDKVDDAKAKAIAGVLQIVRLTYGVGVIAQTAVGGIRRQGRPLNATWTRTGKAWGFNTEEGAARLCARARPVAAGQAVGQGGRRGRRHAVGRHGGGGRVSQRPRLPRPDGAAECGRVRFARRPVVRAMVRRAVENDRRDGRGRRTQDRAGQDHLSRHVDGRRLRAARSP